MLKALSETSAQLLVGDRWVMDFLVLDDDGYLASDPTVAIQFSQPDGDQPDPAPTAQLLSTGVYRVAMTVSEFGRYVVVVSADGYGATGFTAFTQSVSEAGNLPTPDDVRAYSAGSLDADWLDGDIQTVLDSEASQQRQRLSIGAIYPPDLFEALCRRVVIALDRRQKLNAGDFSTGVLGGETQAFIPVDPEIKRLEAPYRKVVMI